MGKTAAPKEQGHGLAGLDVFMHEMLTHPKAVGEFSHSQVRDWVKNRHGEYKGAEKDQGLAKQIEKAMQHLFDKGLLIRVTKAGASKGRKVFHAAKPTWGDIAEVPEVIAELERLKVTRESFPV
jgi:hypothetical protein